MFEVEQRRLITIVRMPSRQSKLQEDNYFRMLRLLQDSPAITQREMAKVLGMSLGGLNYCLKALLDKGMVKIHNFQGSRRKLAYAYLLTPSGIAEKASLAGRFLKRKMDEYAALRSEIESLQSEASRVDDARKVTL